MALAVIRTQLIYKLIYMKLMRGSNSLARGSVSKLTGESFMDMVQDSPYKKLLRVPAVYDVYIDRSQWHWFLLVKMKDSDLPFVSFEVTTPNLTDLEAVMKVPDNESIKGKEYVGEYQGNITVLCQTADEIMKRMGQYGLLSSNCQHFCNNVLNSIGLATFPPTVGPTVTVDVSIERHSFGQRLDLWYSRTVVHTPRYVGTMAAAVVGALVGV